MTLTAPPVPSRSIWPLATLAVLLVTCAYVALALHAPGHEWGDDQSLYIDQARSLLRGNTNEVASRTQYALSASGWDFTPPVYPWGFPFLLAPLYAVVGLDWDLLKVLPTAALVVAMGAIFFVFRPRLGSLCALALTSAFAFSTSYLWWSDWVLSDLVYLAMCFGLFCFIDSLRVRGFDGSRPVHLILFGLLLALGAETRREGFAVIAAALVAHALAVVPVRHGRKAVGRAIRSLPWPVLALPYVTCAAALGLVQLLLPGELLPSYKGSGFSNSGRAWHRHTDNFAQLLGLRETFTPDKTRLFDQRLLGRFMVIALIVLCVLGILFRLLDNAKSDAHLVVYLALSVTSLARTPFYETRYIFPLAPLAVYFAIQAIPTFVRLVVHLIRGRKFNPKGTMFTALILASTSVVVSPILIENVGQTRRLFVQHLRGETATWGPASRSSQELFAAVSRLTGPDDVVAFFRARTMSLETGRKSFQPLDVDALLKSGQFYAMQRDSTYSQVLLTPADAALFGYYEVWSNSVWILWKRVALPAPSP